MRKLSVALFLLGFISSCSFFHTNKVLIYSADGTMSEEVEARIKTAAGDVIIDKSTAIAQLHEDTLKQYSAVVFVGKIDHKLNHKQRAYIERYCQAGGGLAFLDGIPPSVYAWPWAKELTSQKGKFYFDGGKVLIGKEEFDSELSETVSFLLEGGAVDYTKVHAQLPPADNRFVKVVLDDELNEPMEMDVTHDGRVIYTERRGLLKMYFPEENKTKVLADFDVRTEGNYEDGLQGIALDPQHKTNGWVYIYYSVPNTNLQRLSRFFLSYDTLLMQSEKKILDVEVQIETCCHSGGSVQFGPDGLLYLSTGDNTSSKESDGYSPIDERPGRAPFDAQKSSGNTHDLRGKILRIKVNRDATYEIPDGNLFPKDGSAGRPEIYVMGARNPFRISIDAKRNYLYWGDVGPDSGKDGLQGPQSYDEFNRAKAPGNYGWPYFQADNKPYPDWDFTTNTPGPLFDPKKPINDSPYNTGNRVLPPAQEAMIFYPYSTSEKWPVLGKGSRSAMAGPVYYSGLYPSSGRRFPSYYDGKLFIYEWSRSWINVVTFDENEEVYDIEPFLPEMDLAKPIDIEFGPDGAMYLLEYGGNYFANNEDARLSRIEFAEGNRQPVAVITVDKNQGATPLTINFSAARSYDFDSDDQLTYSWQFAEGQQATGEQVSFTLEHPGEYIVQLTATDQSGASSVATHKIMAGNAPPHIAVSFKGNRSFYFGHNKVPYAIEVADKEDGKLSAGEIKREDVSIQFHYVSQGKDLAVLGENNVAFNPYLKGKSLIEGSDCKSCHDISASSIGPSYKAIAGRYSATDENLIKLGTKIIEGGNGVWGHSLMAAHPQHTLAETKEMVRYILSLTGEGTMTPGAMPVEGELVFDKHNLESTEASYVMTVRYKDKGASGLPAIARQQNIIVRHPRLEAEDYDDYKGIARLRPYGGAFAYLGGVKDGTYIMYKDIDLQNISQISYRVKGGKQGTKIQLRLDAPDGKIVSEAEVSADAGKEYRVLSAPINAKGVHDVYVYFENKQTKAELFNLDWVEFAR